MNTPPIPSTIPRWVRAKVRPEGALGTFQEEILEVEIPNQGGHDQTIADIIAALRRKGYETEHVLDHARHKEFL